MQIAIGFGREGVDSWQQAGVYAVEAEKLGVGFVWTAEAWGHDAVTPLAYLAALTSRIRLGSGIMQVGSRSPALAGMTALSLAEMSNDRFIMGLGASGPQVMEGWHGVRFAKPIQRMREYAEIVRTVVRGERLAYKGQIYELPLPGGEGKALKTSARPHAAVPIYMATLTPKSLEMTGEVADGWLGTSFMPEHADIFLTHIKAGAERAGRALTDLNLQAGGAVAFGDDLDRLLAPRRSGAAFQLGAMGSRRHNFYNQAFQRAGYADVALRVQSLWLDGRRDEAAATVPDELILQTNLLGTQAMVRERIRRYRDAGINTLRVQPAGATMAERLETLGRVVRLVQEVSAETPARAV